MYRDGSRKISLLHLMVLCLVLAALVPTTAWAETLDPFCGRSTKAACKENSDCQAGGCSGQVCGAKDDPMITTCEWKECYDEKRYGLSCGCAEGECQWHKTGPEKKF